METPATCAESGQQYGGNFLRCACGVHAALYDDLAFILRQPIRSLDDRVKLVDAGQMQQK